MDIKSPFIQPLFRLKIYKITGFSRFQTYWDFSNVWTEHIPIEMVDEREKRVLTQTSISQSQFIELRWTFTFLHRLSAFKFTIHTAGLMPSNSFNHQLPVFRIIFLPSNEVKNNLICDEYLWSCTLVFVKTKL